MEKRVVDGEAVDVEQTEQGHPQGEGLHRRGDEVSGHEEHREDVQVGPAGHEDEVAEEGHGE